MIFEFWEIFIGFIQNNLIPLGGWGVFLATFLAQIIPPISTPVLVIASGVFFLPDSISIDFFKSLIFVIALPAASGITIGSLFLYSIGFFLGKPFLERWGKFFKLSWDDVLKLEKKFESSYWDEAALFGLRAFPIIPTSSISLVCGLIRFKLSSYLFFTFLGTFVKVLMLAPLGWQASIFYHNYVSLIGGLEALGLVIVFVVVSVFVFYKIFRKNSK